MTAVKTAAGRRPLGSQSGWEIGVVAIISGILAQFLIASSFGVDAFGAVLFSGCLAARHLQATVRLGARDIGRCADRCGGFAQRRKQ